MLSFCETVVRTVSWALRACEIPVSDALWKFYQRGEL
jgi:hypothetical protein